MEPIKIIKEALKSTLASVKKNRPLAAIFLSMTLALSCKHPSTATDSQIQSQSNKLNTVHIDIEGQLSLPIDESPYMNEFLLDSLFWIHGSTVRSIAESNFQKISTINRFKNAFKKSRRNAYPILRRDNSLDITKVAYWVRKQIQYAYRDADKNGTALRFQQLLEPPEYSIEQQSRRVSIKYKARLEAMVEKEKFSFFGIFTGPKADTELKMGQQFVVPEYPLEVYFKLMPEAAASFSDPIIFTKARLYKRLVKRHSPLASQFGIEKMRVSQYHECFMPKEQLAYIAPLNIHYYYLPNNQGCNVSPKTSSIRISAIHSIESPESFPEYHKLFERGQETKQARFFYYFLPVQHKDSKPSPDKLKNPPGDKTTPPPILEDDIDARKFIGELLTKGFLIDRAIVSKRKKVKTLDRSQDLILTGNHFYSIKDVQNADLHVAYAQLSKVINDIRFVVTVVVERYNEDARKQLQNALSTEEVIVLSGHAGYGKNYEGDFINPDNYDPNLYQLLVFAGCRGYRYGMDYVLDMKGLYNLDHENLNMDILATVNLLRGSHELVEIINVFEQAADSYQTANWPKNLIAQLNWNGVTRRLNAAIDGQFSDAEEDTNYVVLGEEHNEFKPGYTKISTFERNSEQLEKLVLDGSAGDSKRVPLLDELIQSLLDPGLTPLQKVLDRSRSICESIANENGGMPGWGKRAGRLSDLNQKNSSYDNTLKSALESKFYQDCSLRSLFPSPNASVSFETYEFDLSEEALSFHPGGQIRKGLLNKPAIVSTGHVFGDLLATGEITFFENGNLRSFISADDIKVRDVFFPSGRITLTREGKYGKYESAYGK